MDKDERQLPPPTKDVPLEFQVEPWAWRDKRMPHRFRAELRAYHRFLERFADGA